MINHLLNRFLKYGMDKNLINVLDVEYTANRMLAFLKLDEFIFEDIIEYDFLNDVKDLVNYALENSIINDTVYEKEIFIASFMDLMMPRPSSVQSIFDALYENSPKQAVDYFYALSNNSYYIQYDKTSRNVKWTYPSIYGDIHLTINLSKPEKDPKEIALLKMSKSSSYPKCHLCVENVGYQGRINHPARANHRIISIKLNNEDWFFQYSPYAYYNEHSIALSKEHRPMVISKNTFKCLLDFVDLFPHYFIGSNADLPIVGGSILNHDHYQAGNYHFPIEDARVIFKETLDNGVSLSLIKWPLSTIRLNGSDKNKIIETASLIFNTWCSYSDESVDLIAYSNKERHNTITPIARMKNEIYELDLILRNNRTSKEHPLGIFHAHVDVHHIKKENLGLIEVMGLAILPARLKSELSQIKEVINGKIDLNDDLNKHFSIINALKDKKDDPKLDELILEHTASIFLKGLCDAGIFKDDERGFNSFKKFINLIKTRIAT